MAEGWFARIEGNNVLTIVAIAEVRVRILKHDLIDVCVTCL